MNGGLHLAPWASVALATAPPPKQDATPLCTASGNQEARAFVGISKQCDAARKRNKNRGHSLLGRVPQPLDSKGSASSIAAQALHVQDGNPGLAGIIGQASKDNDVLQELTDEQLQAELKLATALPPTLRPLALAACQLEITRSMTWRRRRGPPELRIVGCGE